MMMSLRFRVSAVPLPAAAGSSSHWRSAVRPRTAPGPASHRRGVASSWRAREPQKHFPELYLDLGTSERPRGPLLRARDRGGCGVSHTVACSDTIFPHVGRRWARRSRQRGTPRQKSTHPDRRAAILKSPFSQVSCNILIYFSLNDSMDICTFRRKNNLSQMN